MPHEEGRGACLNDVRFSLRGERLLSDRSKARFNRALYRPEREWLTGRFFRPAENIAEYEQRIPPEAVIESFERLDEAYDAAIPSLEALCVLWRSKRRRLLRSA